MKALVSDFDGTLTVSQRPDDAVLDALGRRRTDGVKVVIATGRMVEELLEVFPDALQHVDAILCEDGARLNCPVAVIIHHARNQDLSRWLRHEFADDCLADIVADAERATRDGLDPERGRTQICGAISQRYMSW